MVMKGREKPARISSFPFLFPSPRIHPGVYIFANLSLTTFVITTRRYDWKIAVFLWVATLVLSFSGCPQPLKPLRKMAFALPFLLLTLFFHAFFTPGTVLFGLGNLFATREGVLKGIWVSQKLAFFFWNSFVITSSVSSAVFFQFLGRSSRFTLFGTNRIRLWIIALFLVIRWLRLLPISWKRQLSEHIKDEPGKLRKTLKGLQYLPQLVGKNLTQMEHWNDLLVTRGYAEGILWIADSPMSSLKGWDSLILMFIFLAWGLWIAYLVQGLL